MAYRHRAVNHALSGVGTAKSCRASYTLIFPVERRFRPDLKSRLGAEPPFRPALKSRRGAEPPFRPQSNVEPGTNRRSNGLAVYRIWAHGVIPAESLGLEREDLTRAPLGRDDLHVQSVTASSLAAPVVHMWIVMDIEEVDPCLRTGIVKERRGSLGRMPSWDTQVGRDSVAHRRAHSTAEMGPWFRAFPSLGISSMRRYLLESG